MKIYNKNDLIDNLDLSNRTTNALKNSGIFSIAQLLNYPREEFLCIKNLGKKSFCEIITIFNKIEMEKIKIIDNTLDFYDNSNCNMVKNDIVGKYIFLYDSISNLKISKKTSNYLMKKNINTIKDFISFFNNEIKNINTKTLEEIKNIKNQIDSGEILVISNYSNFKEELEFKNFIFKLSVIITKKLNEVDFFCLQKDIYKEFLNNKIDYKLYCYNYNIDELLNNSKFYNIFIENKFIIKSIKNYYVSLIKLNNYGISIDYLIKKTPFILKNSRYINYIIQILTKDKVIEILDDNNYIISYKNINEALKDNLNTGKIKLEEYTILKARIEGKTLEDVGHINGITRERVRQIECKIIQKLKGANFRCAEDIYKDIYIRYRTSSEIFEFLCNNKQIYNYMEMMYKKDIKIEKKLPISEAINDITIPKSIRLKIEKFVYKDYVKFGNEYIPLKSSYITDYVIKNFAKEALKFEDFKNYYYMLLEDIGEYNNESLCINDRTYENKFINKKNTLWKPGKKLKYYNFDDYDYTYLLKTLNLEQYDDLEYSTRKFFLDYQELMKSYNIDDEYELHNLLKKICNNNNKCLNIKFGRNPTIIFGKADKDSQIIELILNSDDINSKYELASLYEEEYGVKAETFLGSYYKPIFEKYMNEIRQNKGNNGLTLDEKKYLEETLTEKFYMIRDIKKIFLKRFPDSNIKKINKYNMDILGFIMKSGYLIKCEYRNLSNYLKELFSADIIYMEDFPSGVKSNSTFYSNINKLKKSYSIFEFEKDKFINFNKLNDSGITIELIKDFINNVKEFVGYSKYFTIYSIIKEGFYHELFEYGFDYFFYSNILIQQDDISYLKLGCVNVMILGKHKIYSESIIGNILFSVDDLSMDIYDFKEYIFLNMGISIEIGKLIEIIHGSEMYYNPIFEKVYLDRDLYYDEFRR